MPEFSPSESKTAIVPMSNPTSKAFDYRAELYMGTALALMSQVDFHLDAGEEKGISLPVTMPTGAGTYPVYIGVFSAGENIALYKAIEDVVITGAVPQLCSFDVPPKIASSSEFWATQVIYLPYQSARLFLPSLRLGLAISTSDFQEAVRKMLRPNATSLTISNLAMPVLSSAIIGTPPYIYCWEELDSSREYTIKGVCNVTWDRFQDPAKASFYCSSMLYWEGGISYMITGGWYPLPLGRYNIISDLRYADVVNYDTYKGWWDVWRDVIVGETEVV